MEELSEYLDGVLEEHAPAQFLTFTQLAKMLDVHVDIAKTLLYAYAESRKEKVLAKFFVSGKKKETDSEICIRLIDKQDIDTVCEEFEEVCTIHAYSVQAVKDPISTQTLWQNESKSVRQSLLEASKKGELWTPQYMNIQPYESCVRVFGSTSDLEAIPKQTSQQNATTNEKKQEGSKKQENENKEEKKKKEENEKKEEKKKKEDNEKKVEKKEIKEDKTQTGKKIDITNLIFSRKKDENKTFSSDKKKVEEEEEKNKTNYTQKKEEKNEEEKPEEEKKSKEEDEEEKNGKDGMKKRKMNTHDSMDICMEENEEKIKSKQDDECADMDDIENQNKNIRKEKKRKKKKEEQEKQNTKKKRKVANDSSHEDNGDETSGHCNSSRGRVNVSRYFAEEESTPKNEVSIFNSDDEEEEYNDNHNNKNSDGPNDDGGEHLNQKLTKSNSHNHLANDEKNQSDENNEEKTIVTTIRRNKKETKTYKQGGYLVLEDEDTLETIQQTEVVKLKSSKKNNVNQSNNNVSVHTPNENAESNGGKNAKNSKNQLVKGQASIMSFFKKK